MMDDVDDSGVSVSTSRDDRDGCDAGKLTFGGPRNIVFSVFAVVKGESMRVRSESVHDRRGESFIVNSMWLG